MLNTEIQTREINIWNTKKDKKNEIKTFIDALENTDPAF
jgi:ribosomal protein S7